MCSQYVSKTGSDEEIIRGSDIFDCGGRCPLAYHVKDGRIVRIETDDLVEPDQQLRACFRGRAYRQWIYHPDRLKSPMKRTGSKGEGKFEPISWDEALDTIAREMKRVKETYGNSALFVTPAGGHGALHSNPAAMFRLFAMFGGYTTAYGNVSSEGPVWAAMTQYGTVLIGNSREDLVNSKLIILWGWDPVRMFHGTNTPFHIIRAKEAGARIISIDPRFQDSAARFADQWIPIRPGTDTAMMVSMAYVMVSENLHDRKFLDKYTIGFDKFRDYVMGIEDGIKKTPAWAESITGVPAATIEKLAREYATTKPAAMMDALGPARSAMGEQFTRCAMTLSAMTGNVGRSGGSSGGGLMGLPIGHMFRTPSVPVPKNLVEAGAPSIRGTLDLKLRLTRRIHVNKVFDAFIKGKEGGYPTDIKLAWFFATNWLNQYGNINKGVEALKKPEFLIVSDLFITPTARFADIVLPVSTSAERNDLGRAWPSGPYFVYQNKAIEPIEGSKSDFQIACALAPRLGITDFNDKTEDEWLRELVKTAPDMLNEVKDYEKYKKEGVHRVKLPEPIVAFKQQIEDLEHNPFPTPSGKIEIFSQRVADLNNPLCPPVPKYVKTFEGKDDPLAKTYPLQLLSPHPKARAHSTLYNVPWLKELDPQVLWINPVDAEARGIADGEDVMIFNDRGKVIIPAWVTKRIMPGVLCLYEGAWYTPDAEGIDRGGCPNVLTKDEYSPGGASTVNTVLVQVKKA